MAEVKIPTKIKYYISYHHGMTYFENGNGQFYSDLLYPDSKTSFEGVAMEAVDELDLTTTIYAENAKNSSWNVSVKKTEQGYSIKKHRQ